MKIQIDLAKFFSRFDFITIVNDAQKAPRFEPAARGPEVQIIEAPAPKAPKAEAPTPKAEVTREMCGTELLALNDLPGKGRDAVVGVLKAFGLATMKELKPEMYEAFYAATLKAKAA